MEFQYSDQVISSAIDLEYMELNAEHDGITYTNEDYKADLDTLLFYGLHNISMQEELSKEIEYWKSKKKEAKEQLRRLEIEYQLLKEDKENSRQSSNPETPHDTKEIVAQKEQIIQMQLKFNEKANLENIEYKYLTEQDQNIHVKAKDKLESMDTIFKSEMDLWGKFDILNDRQFMTEKIVKHKRMCYGSAIKLVGL